MLPMACHRASKVRAFAALEWVFSFEKAISIVLRSGLWSLRPRRRRRRWQEQEPGAPIFQNPRGFCALLGGEIVEDDNVSHFERRRESGLDPEIEGGTIHGPVDDSGCREFTATQPDDEALRAPTAERASPSRRSTRRARPRRRTIFVVTAVSSTTTKCAGSARTRAWRRMAQVSRASRTSARSRSAAIEAFFVCVALPAEKPRQRRRIDLDAMRCQEPFAQLRHRIVRRFLHDTDQERGAGNKLARTGRGLRLAGSNDPDVGKRFATLIAKLSPVPRRAAAAFRD